MMESIDSYDAQQMALARIRPNHRSGAFDSERACSAMDRVGTAKSMSEGFRAILPAARA
jgi:hypothetical protein